MNKKLLISLAVTSLFAASAAFANEHGKKEAEHKAAENGCSSKDGHGCNGKKKKKPGAAETKTETKTETKHEEKHEEHAH